MARIRTIKPSFWEDDDVVQLSRDARLLAIGLISLADDDGRFVATYLSIAGYVFKHDNVKERQLQAWMDEIAATGMVQFYTVGSRRYGWFPKWKKHQKINRAYESSLPEPPVNGSVSHSLNDSVSGSVQEGKG